MTEAMQRFPGDESLGLVAALRRAEAKNPDIIKAMRDGKVSPRLFDVPKELPVDWTYVQATALTMTISLNSPTTRDDVYRIAAEALPDHTPERAAEIAEACIHWGASL